MRSGWEEVIPASRVVSGALWRMKKASKRLVAIKGALRRRAVPAGRGAQPRTRMLAK